MSLSKNTFKYKTAVKASNTYSMGTIITCLLIFYFSAMLNAQSDTIILASGWRLHSTAIQDTLSCNIPTYVPIELSKASIMPSLFHPDFEQSWEKFDDKDWTFELNLTLSKSDLSADFFELQCHGLDTYADIYWNERWIGRSGNMFIPYKIDIKPYIEEGENSLKIRLNSINKASKEVFEGLEISNWPGDARVVTRKAQYMFGWDWAPNIAAPGIWQPIYLIKSNQIKIDQVEIETTYQYLTEFGKILGSIHFFSRKEQAYTIRISLDDRILLEKPLILSEESTDYKFEIDVNRPELWWPNGYGFPKLYALGIQLLSAKEEILWQFEKKVGFRQVDLMTEKDSIGMSFGFRVNGIEIFAKGANWIPLDFFPTMASKTRYEKSLGLVKAAHLNILRVWGGGLYEKDYFYNLCDSLGILVWQDFMFACAMYPNIPGFMQSIEKEATYQIKRLNAHPSILLWCGNNEIAEGWANWGWQKGKSSKDIKYLEAAYREIFKELLPNLIQKYSHRPYWESSPFLGRGNPDYDKYGNAHDWFVWHDEYPVGHLLNRIPRFMTEFGIQSLPSRYLMDQYTLTCEKSKNINDLWTRYQKNARGNSLILHYILEEFPKPKDVEQFIYLSQVMQAKSISDALGAHRSAFPYCRGSLFWQWNDCWPAVSWSATMYRENPKALYYEVKRAFAPITLYHDISKNKLAIVTEKPDGQILHCRISCFNIYNKQTILLEDSIWLDREVNILTLEHLSFPKNCSTILIEGVNRNTQIRQLSIIGNLKMWKVKRKGYTMKLNCERNQCELKLYTKKLLYGVILDLPLDLEVEDRYLHMLPHESKTWRFEKQSEMSIKKLKRSIRITSLIR